MKYFFILLFTACIFANELNFSIIKKCQDVNVSHNTLLVIGGIQGDEPGGFLAASLLATEYDIKNNPVWIVPNLNFPSIIKSSRGLNGDMNRKFANIKEVDPDFYAVETIKNLITSPEVALIINLHDGSGFYRHKYIDSLHNQRRWGNSSIIDQVKIKDIKYGNLEEIANKVVNSINQKILDEEHTYHIKNTKTKEGDVEMLKSLTYFAITNKKAAFANEASKTLNASQRTYYHLLAIEAYMNIMGIEFTRNFELSLDGVEEAINKQIDLSLFDNKLYFSLKNPKDKIRYVPMPYTKEVNYQASNPLTAVVKEKDGFVVHYGNRKITKLLPQYFKYDDENIKAQINIDGVEKTYQLGSIIEVKDYFIIKNQKNLRVNVIGYVGKKRRNDFDEKIHKKSISKIYSIDKKEDIFRAEFYKTNKEEDEFLGMILVKFVK